MHPAPPGAASLRVPITFVPDGGSGVPIAVGTGDHPALLLLPRPAAPGEEHASAGRQEQLG